MWKYKKQFEFIMTETKDTLSDVNEDLLNVDVGLSEVINRLKMGELKVKLKDYQFLASEAYTKVAKYLSLFDTIATEYKTEVLDRLDILESENIQLKEYIRSLEKALKDKDVQIEKLETEVKNKEEIEQRLDSVDSLLEMINDNAKSLAFSKRVKDPNINKKGVNSPKYKEVDEEQLIKDYEAGMILRVLADKYGLTVPGIRYKLIELGVYKPVYKSKH